MTATPTNGTRAALIEGLVPLAGELAKQEHRKLPPWVGLDEARSVAYLALVGAVDRYDASRGVPLAAWVRMPIRGAVRDLGRRKEARLGWVPTANSQPGGEFIPPEDVPDPAPDVESVAAYRQAQGMIWGMVSRLPAQLQAVVRLRYCTGLSNGEIGRLLRVRVGASAVSRLHGLAIQILRGGAGNA